MPKLGSTKYKTLEEALLGVRFINPFSKPIPFCWECTKSLNSKGYGQIYFNRKPFYVHRVSAHLWLGFDLKSNLLVCHKCDNPKCFNPEHLFIGTDKDNKVDCISKNRIYSKLNKDDVIDIMELYNSGLLITCEEIAEIYDVHRVTIQDVVSHRSWKHVK